MNDKLNQMLRSDLLDKQGLNLHAAFDVKSLPENIVNQLPPHAKNYQQLILVGHGGSKMWSVMRDQIKKKTDPIDEYSVNCVRQWMHIECPENRYEIIYPSGELAIPLTKLGVLAGWQQESPLLIGINRRWGLWFAYRVALLADTNFEVVVAEGSVFDPSVKQSSPCTNCVGKECVQACPAKAIKGNKLDLNTCVVYRQEDASLCKDRCVARLSCPVKTEHQYTEEQIVYHYTRSLISIIKYNKSRD